MILGVLQPAIYVNKRKFKVVRKIGEGGFAFVYEVRSTQKEDQYAHYALKKMLCQESEQVAEAKKEVDLLNKIKHTNVLPLLDHSVQITKQSEQEVCLLMPLYHSSIQHVIDKGPGPPYCGFSDGLDVVKVLRHCAEGLQAIHNHGYRHADFKPANILITQTYGAVIADFGSASAIPQAIQTRSEVNSLREAAATFTTASIRAPELFEPIIDSVVDGKADVWSFGCVMYAMLFSRTPFETATEGLSVLSVLGGKYALPPTTHTSHSPTSHPSPVPSLWPCDYLELTRDCLCVDMAARLSMEDVRGRLKRLSSPPLDLAPPAVESSPPSLASPPTSVQMNQTSQTPRSPQTPNTPQTLPNSPALSLQANAGKDEEDIADFADFSQIAGVGKVDVIEGNGGKNPDNALGEDVLRSVESVDFGNDSDANPFSDLAEIPTPAFSSTDSPIPPTSEAAEGAFGDFVYVSHASTSGVENTANGQINPSANNADNGAASHSTNSHHVALTPPPSISPSPSSSVDLYSVILNQCTVSFKEGSVNTMRYGGWPKKLMKKRVSLLLTAFGVVIKKEGVDGRVHHVISFHKPLSLTPSDMYAVGKNGVMIVGSSPVSSEESDSDMGSGGSGKEKRLLKRRSSSFRSPTALPPVITEDWVKVDNLPSTRNNSAGDGQQSVRSKFIPCQVEISFDSREDMNVWIDAIMNQYEAIRG
eukprot:gene23145-28128_t